MLLTLTLIFAGIVMVFRVFQQYETLIIENEDRQLLGLARSVDRSITSYLQQISRDLQHTLQRDGIEEAEKTYRRTGDPARQLEENILTQHPWPMISFGWRAKPSCIPHKEKTTTPFPPTPDWRGMLPSVPVWTPAEPSIFLL